MTALRSGAFGLAETVRPYLSPSFVLPASPCTSPEVILGFSAL